MDTLKALVNEVFKDTLYESDVTMRSDRDKNLIIT